jgi:signal transduction histidine kinase
VRLLKFNEEYVLHLLSNFTHQVINPLNGVIGTIDNLLDGTTQQEKYPVRLRSVRGQLECTVSLIRNLAFFAQYTADYGQIKRHKLEKICVVPQILIEALSFYQEQAIQRNISIELRERWKQLAVKGNPDLFRQVMMNIYDNAVKYGLPNTMIETKMWIQKKTGDLIVTVSGPSIGFDANENIFELGTRGASAVNELSSGTGIGLHVCKLIVENVFGGKISGQHVHSTKLTKFDLRFPGGYIHGDQHR